MKTGKTEHGLSYAVSKSTGKVAYCALGIPFGTRDEEGFPDGIAHFTEHGIFKGTLRKRSSEINSCLEKLGGDLNAYTTKECIVLHARTLVEDFPKAVSLLMELAYEATFPEAGIKLEKGVIVDEIISYKDSMCEDIYDVFEEKLFEGHPLATPILGTKKSVKSTTVEQLREFYGRHFTPDKMCFSAVCSLEEDKIADIISKAERKFNLDGKISKVAPRKLFKAPGTKIFNETKDKKKHEANCMMGGFAPDFYDLRARFAAMLTCNILGGPAMNSILCSTLREKKGLVYDVGCGCMSFVDNGMAFISFGCEKSNVDKCLEYIRKELDKFQSRNMTPTALKSAKKQFIAGNALRLESHAAQCIRMCNAMMLFRKVKDINEKYEIIESLTADEIRETAVKLFSADKINTLIYL